VPVREGYQKDKHMQHLRRVLQSFQPKAQNDEKEFKKKKENAAVELEGRAALAKTNSFRQQGLQYAFPPFKWRFISVCVCVCVCVSVCVCVFDRMSLIFVAFWPFTAAAAVALDCFRFDAAMSALSARGKSPRRAPLDDTHKEACNKNNGS